MAQRTFSAGDMVYSINGNAGNYVARVHNGHLVEPIYDDEESGEPRFDKPRVWPEVFTKPPVERVHAEVAEAEKKLEAVRAELTQMREQRAAFEREERARQERIKQHEQLAALDDYLAGRITHFVVTSQYAPPSIITFEEAIVTTDEDRGSKKLRLLGLFGDPKRNLRWKVMWYSDGSGSEKHEVFPCTSLEQATARLTELVNNGWGYVRGEGRIHLIVGTVKLARDMGLSVPQDIAEAADRITQEGYLKAVKSRREAAEKALRELDEAKEAARAAGVQEVAQ